MTIRLSARPVATVLLPLGERLWIFGPVIAAGLLLMLVTLPWARKRFRQSRRQRPFARLVWIMAGVGMELLAGGTVAVGIYGVLGFDSLAARVFLAIAMVCGALGILVSCSAIIVDIITLVAGVIGHIRYDNDDASPEG